MKCFFMKAVWFHVWTSTTLWMMHLGEFFQAYVEGKGGEGTEKGGERGSEYLRMVNFYHRQTKIKKHDLFPVGTDMTNSSQRCTLHITSRWCTLHTAPNSLPPKHPSWLLKHRLCLTSGGGLTRFVILKMA